MCLWGGQSLGAAGLSSEDQSRWRITRVAGGLASDFSRALSLSPAGNLWVTHLPGEAVSWMDGFEVHRVLAPGGDLFRVHESRSGQVWSLYAKGILEFRRDRWMVHTNEAIEAANQSPVVQRWRPGRLLPAERDRALVVLPDRIIKYHAAQRRTVVLRRAEATTLGVFRGLMESRDGGAWVIGDRGVAKLPGPVRWLSEEAPWAEYALPENSEIELTGRAFEDDEGGVLVLGILGGQAGEVAVPFNGERWLPELALPPGAMNVWRGYAGELWAHTRTSLWRRRVTDWELVPVPGLGPVQIFDAAVESNGDYWLATAGGVVRHSMSLWRRPPGDESVDQPVYAVAEAKDGRVAFAGPRGLLFRENQDWTWQSWPEPPPTLSSGTRLWPSPDGEFFVFRSSGGVSAWDHEAHQYRTVTYPSVAARHFFLGVLRDGRAAVQITPEGQSGGTLEAFDGEEFERLFEIPEDWEAGTTLTCLRETLEGARWLGTDQGLARWDVERGEFVGVTAPVGAVVGLADMGGGRIWCGSGHTLAEFDGRAWSVVRSDLVGLQRLVSARDGSVWLIVGDRLLRYREGTWIEYGRPEGLPGQPVHDVSQDERGDLWAATDTGIWQFHREYDLDAPQSSFADGQTLGTLSIREVPQIRFRGRDRWDITPEGRLLFATRLDERSWSGYASSQQVILTNLTAGPHRLAVRAMDRSGNEESDPQVVTFTAFVPWYAEPRIVAVGIAAILVAALLAWLAVNRHYQVLRSYERVEQIVAQRTRELEQVNRELLHSQKMQALGTLAAGIAHDFNSILSIIKGSAQIIEDNLENRTKIQRRVDRIKVMVEQGAGLVKAMLGLSRGQSSEQQSLEVNQLLTQVVRLMADQLPAGAALKAVPQSGLPRVRVVPDLLRQIIMNLAINAADALSGQGQVVLRSGFCAQLPGDLALPPEPAGPCVFIEVSDTGHGIPGDILPRIFEPFFTTKALSTRKGTGLGLTMVYEIAKEAGLGLKVASPDGEGATFTVLIPAHEV